MNKFVRCAPALLLSLCVAIPAAPSTVFAQMMSGVTASRSSSPARVLVTIKAESKAEALVFARQLKNFHVDESFGALDKGDGVYLVCGDETGVLSDAGAAAGHVIDVQSDSVSRPGGLN